MSFSGQSGAASTFPAGPSAVFREHGNRAFGRRTMSTVSFQNNRITELLGIRYPIIGAPMFLVSYPDLVCAVSEAGGIGCFPAANYRTPQDLRAGLAEIRARTKNPIGVNIILEQGHNPKWRAQLKTALEERAELIIFSLGARRDVVREAQAAGARVFFDVTTLRHARIAQKSGVDGIIAVAQGAGGHAGAISPLSLIPYIKQQVEVPVIASGAISTGAQAAAAFCLGADAVYIGTRLIATPEAQAEDAYKQMIVKSGPEQIVYSEKVSGIPANWLGDSFQRFMEAEPGSMSGGDERKRWRDIWSAGHGVAQIDGIVPAGIVIETMARECASVLSRLAREIRTND